MIKVYVKEEEQRITRIIVTGHAYYDEPGKDVVCAAISALTIGTVNSVEILLNIDLYPEEDQKKGGYLAWDVPLIEDINIDAKLQLLMKAMVESLKMIENDYKKYIKVTIEAS